MEFSLFQQQHYKKKESKVEKAAIGPAWLKDIRVCTHQAKRGDGVNLSSSSEVVRFLFTACSAMIGLL